MACGKCLNCGAQMEEEGVYGKKVCRCPDCGWKGPIKAKEGMVYDKTPSMKEK